MIMDIDRELSIQFVLMILGVITAFWNVFVFVSAQNSKKESKKSELKALEYAGQADEYYKKVIEFYDNEEEKQKLEVELLRKTKEIQEVQEMKNKVFAYVRSNGSTKTSNCAKSLKISPVEAFDILHELCYTDRVIGTGGSTDKDNIDKNIWISSK